MITVRRKDILAVSLACLWLITTNIWIREENIISSIFVIILLILVAIKILKTNNKFCYKIETWLEKNIVIYHN